MLPKLTFHAADPAQFRAQNVEEFAYPMGEPTVRRTGDLLPGAQVCWTHTAAPDWTVIAAWSDLVRASDPGTPRVLVMPFLPGARGDKDTPAPARVNARLTAATGVTHLVTADPHSDVWLDTLRACAPQIDVHVLPLPQIVVGALGAAYINDDPATRGGVDTFGYDAVISPDAGARRRAQSVADAIGVPLHVAAKTRDPETGRITGYRIDTGLHRGTVLVVDDICDGGATFARLRNALPDAVDTDLWVTHGGFTQGTAVLDGYRRIHTTDSLWRSVDTVERVTTASLFPFVARIVNDIIEEG